ncbi:ACOX2.2 family protein [Megaselia abdita]
MTTTMIPSTMNTDLQNERRKASLNSEKFAEWWFNGRAELAKKRELESVIFNDAQLNDDIPISYLSYKESYENAMRKSTRLLYLIKKYYRESDSADASTSPSKSTAINKKDNDEKAKWAFLYKLRSMLGGEIGSGILKQGNPIRLHITMFLPTILGQASEEQKLEWMEKCFDLKIIGTYAQTELGHGTFLRGLETRADYDPSTKQFVLNSPTRTSYKWWPGGLGHTVNYTIVMAQMYVDGKSHGIQPFVIQVRDEETHMPLSGIDIGDIGPKMGLKHVNNGYLGFHNVRIPRTNMLMKNCQVLEDGTVRKAKSSVLVYGGMVFVRVVIVRDASFALIMAGTIAARYSAVRRQSPIESNTPEPQVIDHITQQLKVFPQIAKGIVFKLAADYVWDLYQTTMSSLDEGNLNGLAELHLITCGLKAYTSNASRKGVEILRLACGGHGYMESANFVSIYGTAAASCTYEGETTVMWLQTARYLMKAWGAVIKGEKLAPSVSYLKYAHRETEFKGFTPNQWSVIRALQFTAGNLIKSAYETLEKTKENIESYEVAKNLTGLRLVKAAELHTAAFLADVAFRQIKKQLNSIRNSKEVMSALNQMLDLFLVDMFFEYLSDILKYCQLSGQDVDAMEKRLENNLKLIRPNIIALVDGFDLHDRVLDSTLGSYDGNVYERIFDNAKKNPLNQEPVNSSYVHLKAFMKMSPFMKSNL